MKVEDPVYFETADEFREWLKKNHDKAPHLWVAYYKKGAPQTGITYREAVDEALCFGWIDGRVNTIDQHSYAHRYTPRRKGSIWSQVNIRRYCELLEAGRVHPAGKKTFDERDEKKQNLYSFEQEKLDLGIYEKKFRANKKAWANFNKMIASYRKPAIWWVIGAKQEATRERRLQTLIEYSERGEKIPPLQRPADKAKAPAKKKSAKSSVSKKGR